MRNFFSYIIMENVLANLYNNPSIADLRGNTRGGRIILVDMCAIKNNEPFLKNDRFL